MENVHFTQKLTKLREWLPTASFVIITIVYITSAAVEALSINAEIGQLWLACLIGISLQAVRAIVVFFGQLNPEKPDFGWSREIIAAALAGFSIYSVYGLSQLNGWSFETTFSMCSLMGVGAVVEVMILREIKSATIQQLMNDPQAMKRLQDGAIKKANYKQFSKIVKDVESGKIKADQANLTTNYEHAQLASVTAERDQLKTEAAHMKAATEETIQEINRLEAAAHKALQFADQMKAERDEVRENLQKFKDSNQRFHANEKILLKNADTWKTTAEQLQERERELRQEVAALRAALDSSGSSSAAAELPTTADGPPASKPAPTPPTATEAEAPAAKADDFDKVTPNGERVAAGSSFDFDF